MNVFVLHNDDLQLNVDVSSLLCSVFKSLLQESLYKSRDVFQRSVNCHSFELLFYLYCLLLFFRKRLCLQQD